MTAKDKILIDITETKNDEEIMVYMFNVVRSKHEIIYDFYITSYKISCDKKSIFFYINGQLLSMIYINQYKDVRINDKSIKGV